MLLSAVLFIISTCLFQFSTTISFFSRHKASAVAMDDDNLIFPQKQKSFPGYTYISSRNHLSLPTFRRSGLEESDRASYGRAGITSFSPIIEDSQNKLSRTKEHIGYPQYNRVEGGKDHLKSNTGLQPGTGSSNRHIFFDVMGFRNNKVNLVSNPFPKYKDFSEGVQKLFNTPNFFPRNIYQNRYKSNPLTPKTLNPVDFTISILTPSRSSLFSSPLRLTQVGQDFNTPKLSNKNEFDSDFPIDDTFLSEPYEKTNDRREVNVLEHYENRVKNLPHDVINEEKETFAKPNFASIELIGNLETQNDVLEDKSNSSGIDGDRIANALDKYLGLSADRKQWSAGEGDIKNLEDLPKTGSALDFFGMSKLSSEISKSPEPATTDNLMIADRPSQMDPSPSFSIDSVKTEYVGNADDVHPEKEKERTHERFEHNKPSFNKIFNELKNENLRIYASPRNTPEKEYFPLSRESDQFQRNSEVYPFQVLPKSDPFKILPKSDPFQTFSEGDPLQTLSESNPFKTFSRKDDDSRFDMSKLFATATLLPPNTEFENQNYPYGGSWDSDTRDCEIIETKICSANSECSCLGLYYCAGGRCQALPPSAQDDEQPNAERMIWHEPVSFKSQ